ncbi:MAG: glycosyltransferase family 39 protein [Flavobacteriales bacterium]|nr:glycosyltransferase family 39 protein [Flavobacteriales bacterium]
MFLVRLIGIQNPPLESGHNWRQSLTNMVARNFLEDPNILYPKIDMAGEKTGIIGSEFPVFNYLIFLVSALFGFEHWYGRLINLIFSSIGLWSFFRIIREFVNQKVAFNATIVLLFSLWFSYSRKVMPDTFSLSLLLTGLWMGYDYLKSGKILSLTGFFVLCAIGMLSKIPALSVFSLVSVVPFVRKIPLKKRIIFSIVSVLVIIPVLIWYFLWVPYLVNTYKFELYFPRGLVEGLLEIIPLYKELFEKFYFSALRS